MLDNLFEISAEQLLACVQNMMYENYRFVTASCIDNGDGSFDILYHFDRDLTMKNCRVRIRKDEELPSISRIYFCAVLVENEIKELFGVKITDMVLDYGGHLLLSDDSPSAPMAKQQIVIEKKGEDKNV